MDATCTKANKPKKVCDCSGAATVFPSMVIQSAASVNGPESGQADNESTVALDQAKSSQQASTANVNEFSGTAFVSWLTVDCRMNKEPLSDRQRESLFAQCLLVRRQSKML